MIRIISGDYRRRQLRTPKDDTVTRPLPDRVRTALFNMLRGHLEDQTVLDGFAGVGSFGLEAASRGASEVVMVERDREIAEILQSNIDELGASETCRVIKGDVLGLSILSRCPRPVHVIFFDPPYPMIFDPAQRDRIFGQFSRLVQLLDDDGFAIIRTPWPVIDRLVDGKRYKGGPEQPEEDESQGLYPSETAYTIEDFDDPSAAAIEDSLPEPSPKAEEPKPEPGERVIMDLTIEGADGPETHIYRNMAVHWYMKAR